MSKIHKKYIKEVYGNLKYRPTWLPGSPMRLGTVGVIEDGIFRPITSLEDLGIEFSESVDSNEDSIDFSSEKGVAITFKAAGEANSKFEAVPKASAGALLEFSDEGAVVLQLRGVRLHRIEKQPEIYNLMMKSLVVGEKSKQWQRDWVAITEIAEAESATIVISNSSNSKLELKASGTVAPDSLVDVSADFSVAAESQVSTKIISEAGLTPLYRGVRVKRGFLWLFDEVQLASRDIPKPDEVFGDADPSED